jgi:hypothetical protein
MDNDTMINDYSGEIVSAQLARYGDNNTRYGYVTIQTRDQKYVKVKVDAYTSYDTLDIGKQVSVKSETLGDTSILVAKEISRLSP